MKMKTLNLVSPLYLLDKGEDVEVSAPRQSARCAESSSKIRFDLLVALSRVSTFRILLASMSTVASIERRFLSLVMVIRFDFLGGEGGRAGACGQRNLGLVKANVCTGTLRRVDVKNTVRLAGGRRASDIGDDGWADGRGVEHGVHVSLLNMLGDL